MNINNFLRTISTGFLDIILPQECLGCGMSKTWLCKECFYKIPFNNEFPCAGCYRQAWQGATHKECQRNIALNGLLIASKQTDLLKDLVHNFKYQNLHDLSEQLAEMLNKKIHNSPIALTMFLNSKTLLMPIPLYSSKEWDRGYNQSNLLALELVKTWTINLETNAIKRIRNTATQTDLPKHKRLKNVKNAFKVINPELVMHKRIILIDDVMTTGSTILEAARVLKQAGAREIWALVLTRG